MMSTTPGSALRTTVTRIHATCLFVITIATTTASTIGWKGHGPLDVLASQPYGYVGLGVFALLWKAPFLRSPAAAHETAAAG